MKNQTKQQYLALSVQEFIASYEKFLLYLSERDPIIAGYFLAKFPKSLKMDDNVKYKVLRNKKKWLSLKKQQLKPLSLQKDLPSYQQFVNSVYALALIYTTGPMDKYNKYRASKFIRILKILGDKRFQSLEQQLKKKENQNKSL